MAEQLAFWEALDAPARHRPVGCALVALPPAPEPVPVKPDPAPAKADKPRSKSQRAPRRCLSCEKTFPSTGPGNRRCAACRRLESYADAITEYSVQF